MTNTERSQALRWRLGWLPGWYTSSMSPTITLLKTFSRTHSIECLSTYAPSTPNAKNGHRDPLSFLLNQPTN
ncbi:uncharacterized protein BX663DRAFT_514173 [Cokeromyces recurvatus]|uniref:uncharacterized protein n=1 Tax=Cokeromyces recurvatus TaxID=90255 RepID=UPI002220D488|nr:uncharacterized protein BX663DRAFT_514173 [Cokeromyces recurvatus]KAI7901346.1 hypothetical protein BX663DRAFT_514173 [Cokeromyces recurvatus]